MTRRLGSRALGLGALAVALAPAAAQACAVCGGGPDRTRLAFFISTMFLSLLPLALMAGGLIWLARHARARLTDEFLDRDAEAPAHAPKPAPPAGAALRGATPSA